MPQLTDENRSRRRSRVGASELGALPGLSPMHPWTDPARIYARIIDGDGAEQTESMALGHDLERAIAVVAADRLGLEILACRHTYIHPDVPLAATPDYYARTAPAGRFDGLLEVKVSNEFSWWTDGVPPWIVWQVRAQMALSGRTWAYVAVLLNGRVNTYRLDHDPDAWIRAIDAVAEFDESHLTPHIPPGTTDERLLLRWSLEPGEKVADAILEEAGREYLRAVHMRRWADGQEKIARAGFVPLMVASGARVLVGSGWTASINERGDLRFAAVRRASNGD